MLPRNLSPKDPFISPSSLSEHLAIQSEVRPTSQLPAKRRVLGQSFRILVRPVFSSDQESSRLVNYWIKFHFLHIRCTLCLTLLRLRHIIPAVANIGFANFTMKIDGNLCDALISL